MSAEMIGILAAGVVVVLGLAVLGLRHRRRRRDPVVVFSAATDAMKHLGDRPPVDVVTHPVDDTQTPSVRVLPDIAVLKLDRTRTTSGRGRAAEQHRPDAEVLARRPVIASLPSLLSETAVHPSGSDGRRVTGDAAEQN